MTHLVDCGTCNRHEFDIDWLHTLRLEQFGGTRGLTGFEGLRVEDWVKMELRPLGIIWVRFTTYCPLKVIS